MSSDYQCCLILIFLNLLWSRIVNSRSKTGHFKIEKSGIFKAGQQ